MCRLLSVAAEILDDPRGDAVMDPSPGEEEDMDHPVSACISGPQLALPSIMDHSPIMAEGRSIFSDDSVRRGQATDCRH